MGKSNNISPLELEALSFTGVDNESDSQQHQRQHSFQPFLWIQNLVALTGAYASYYSHIVAPVAVICFIVAVVLTLDFVVSASTQKHVAMVKNDYSAISSEYDSKMQRLDHWCLSGGDDDCTCDDPITAMSNEQTNGWVKAFKYNKLLLEPEPSRSVSQIDLVMIGDQSVEEWNARWRGTPNNQYAGAQKYFNENFKQAGMETVALGVAGDSISNLLWRIQHGELSNALYPKVFWVVIGGNDLAIGQCSEGAVVLGILHLVEYLVEKRPGVKIVINSILPVVTTIKPSVGNAHFKPFDLFPSIQVVNEQLEKFCKRHPGVFIFYDATPLFFKGVVPSSAELSKKKKRLPALNSDLIGVNGQLTVEGHKVWGNVILSEYNKIMVGENPDEGSDQDYVDDDYIVYGDDLR